MKLYIPACGDRLTLTKDWAFTLYLESRNIKFAQVHKLIDEKFKRFDGYVPGSAKLKSVQAALPSGTILECDRMYIRTFNKSRVQLSDDYDSITWKVMLKNGKPARNQRFWVKLPDCYTIEYEQGIDDLYRNRVKIIKEVMES